MRLKKDNYFREINECLRDQTGVNYYPYPIEWQNGFKHNEDKKMNRLYSATNILSRSEMKNVMAGSLSACDHECSVGFACCCSTEQSQWLGCYHSAQSCCEACLGIGNCGVN